MTLTEIIDLRPTIRKVANELAFVGMVIGLRPWISEGLLELMDLRRPGMVN